MEALKSAEFVEKEKKRLPAGASVIEKNTRIRVEEIENGFILSKNTDITYEDAQGDRNYMYVEKKWFSKENPMSIEVDTEEDDEWLADKF